MYINVIVDTDGLVHGVKHAFHPKKMQPCVMSWCVRSLQDFVTSGDGCYVSAADQQFAVDTPPRAISCIACIAAGE